MIFWLYSMQLFTDAVYQVISNCLSVLFSHKEVASRYCTEAI